MKILVISNMYPSAGDPTYGTFIRNFYEDVAARNGRADTHLVTIYGRRHSRFAKLLTYIKFYTEATIRLLSHSYDIVYVHTVTFPTPALRVASAFKKLPLVLNVHGDDVLPGTRFKKWLKNMSRPLMKRTRMMVVPSEYFAGIVKREFPELDADKIFISASGGVASDFFVADDRSRDHREELVLGFVSRIDEGKGWHEFLLLMKILRDRGIPCRAIMAGGGGQRKQLTDEIEDFGLGKLVDYRGPLPQSQLIGVYRDIDLFIFPTVRPQESLGLVALEAMAAGAPVVASDMAAPSGYVISGVNGYLFEPGNVGAMVDCVETWLRLPIKSRACMSAEAVATARRYEAAHTAETLYQRLTTIFPSGKQ